MSQKHAPRGPIQRRDSMRDADPLRGDGWRGCTAKSKRSGKPCNGQAIKGATVCRMHGGSAPQVKEAAMERLRALAHPAVDALQWLITQRDFPSAAYSASRDVLDRTEGRPTETVDMNVSGDEALIAALMAGRKRAAESRKDQ
jgi:hypothetical protein